MHPSPALTDEHARAEAMSLARELVRADIAVSENPDDPEAEARYRKLDAERWRRIHRVEWILADLRHAARLKIQRAATDIEPQPRPREARPTRRRATSTTRRRVTGKSSDPDPACAACYRGRCFQHLSDAGLRRLVRGNVQANRAVDSYEHHRGLTPPRPSLSDLLRSGS